MDASTPPLRYVDGPLAFRFGHLSRRYIDIGTTPSTGRMPRNGRPILEGTAFIVAVLDARSRFTVSPDADVWHPTRGDLWLTTDLNSLNGIRTSRF